MCAGLMIDYKKTLCTAHLKILAKTERILQHHGITVGVGIGIGIAIAVAIAIENCA